MENILPLMCLKASTGLLIKIISNSEEVSVIYPHLAQFVPFWTSVRNYLSLRLINTFLRNTCLAVWQYTAFQNDTVIKMFFLCSFPLKDSFSNSTCHILTVTQLWLVRLEYLPGVMPTFSARNFCAEFQVCLERCFVSMKE